MARRGRPTSTDAVERPPQTVRSVATSDLIVGAGSVRVNTSPGVLVRVRESGGAKTAAIDALVALRQELLDELAAVDAVLARLSR